jgi:hypothetical protein
MNGERFEEGEAVPDQVQPATPAAPVGWIPPPPPPPPVVPGGRRSTRNRLAAAVAGVVIVGVGIGVVVGLVTRGSGTTPATGTAPNSASTGAATVQARAAYQQALAALRASAGFHYVADTNGVTGTQRIVGDAAQSGGRQDITLTGPSGREQFTLVLVSGTVYFQGNVAALEDQLGVPAAAAPGVQNRWISVTSQDGPYAVIAPGIVVADQAQETALVPTSTTAIKAAGGAGATRILGTVPPQQGAPAGTGHLDVDAGSHLPLEYVSTVAVSGVSVSTTTSFSGWGTAATQTAPTGAVAWSTLGASEPPGGYGGGGGGGTAPSATPQI